ncbi:MAG: trypco2 family protein [Cyanobacteria bacterium P01_A01_bin.37]
MSIPIAKVIKSLRHELSQAIADGDGQDLKFELGPVELEFQVEVSMDVEGKTGAKGGVQIGVISLGEVSGEAGATKSRGTTHTIKMTLNPINEDGGSVRVSATDTTERPG